MIYAEYLRFLQTLNNETVPKDVRKIANLVIANLDDLVPLTTNQGQRIRVIVALAQAHWETTSSEILPMPESSEEQITNFSHLKSMTVGPFRGFSQQEIFDLENRLVLIYGPNGTGKSSFCEALEYGLLGNVLEAESKRFHDQHDYLKNAYVNQFSPPIITAVDDQGNEIAVAPNEVANRFCFIEKNRIDNFSRIAAQAPAKQIELISTLFGLESFTEFVRNFTAEINGRYVDLVGSKATQLLLKRQTLSGAEQRIQFGSGELELITVGEQGLANHYREGVYFNQMVVELNGEGEISGAIKRLEGELQQPIETKSNLTSVALGALGSSIAITVEELNKKQQDLAVASQQVSFKQLYEAVSQVKPSSPNTCPACKTPLSQVAVNPYTHAGEELQKLQQLAAIEQEAGVLEQGSKQSLFSLSQLINTCLKYYPQSNPLKAYEVINNGQPSIQWWDSLNHMLSDGLSPWQHLVSQVQHLEDADINIDQAVQLRSDKQNELNNLREYARQITVLQTRRQAASTDVASAQQLINNFEIENAQLIADVEVEKAAVLKNQTITTAYIVFVQKLNNYSNNLPAQLVEDLGEIVVTLYNAFNRNDSQSELLATVKLPLAQNQRLAIAFQNQPDRFYDALHVLSEGHIRCLGLAILLAKNIKENASLLIFDDPVNAIDDDHRESIRRTLFEDKYFSDKQILLTCHGEEFFKDIHNLLPVEAASQAKSFVFLPRLGDQHIRVDFNCAPRNYILSARGHLNQNEVRDALSKSRQALEVLTHGKVWNYVTRFGDGNLSLKKRSASSSIELRNLTEQLKSKIGKGDFGDQHKNAIFGPLATLLGVNGDSREWRYLNKGTHEENDRAEFDRHTVAMIVTNLEQLDLALTK